MQPYPSPSCPATAVPEQVSPVPPGDPGTSPGCPCVGSLNELVLLPSHTFVRILSGTRASDVLPSGVAVESEPGSCDAGCTPDTDANGAGCGNPFIARTKSGECSPTHLLHFLCTHVRACAPIVAYNLSSPTTLAGATIVGSLLLLSCCLSNASNFLCPVFLCCSFFIGMLDLDVLSVLCLSNNVAIFLQLLSSKFCDFLVTLRFLCWCTALIFHSWTILEVLNMCIFPSGFALYSASSTVANFLLTSLRCAVCMKLTAKRCMVSSSSLYSRLLQHLTLHANYIPDACFFCVFTAFTGDIVFFIVCHEVSSQVYFMFCSPGPFQTLQRSYHLLCTS